jgi:gas vesicle protein
LLGVLAGIAAGAALGVLFAPGQGSNTRKNISRKTEDLVDAVSDKLEEKFDEVIHVVKGK